MAPAWWPFGRRGEQSAEPVVSVVVPIHDVSAYLAECLDSVQAQTLRSWQVIAVDDGSTDDSAAIAARYADADPRIELHRQANAGLGATRNRAAALARGEYLFFLDSDDRLPVDALARLVAAAREHDADVVMGPLARFTSTRRWMPRWARELHPDAGAVPGLAARPDLVRNHYAAAKLYRRAFWEAQSARFREGVLYEDQPLLTRLLIAADGIAWLPEAVYDYRDRDDGSAIHQQVHTIDDLVARALAWDAAIAMLDEVGASGPIRCAWLHTVLGTHLHYYLDSSGIEDAGYWQTLRGCLLRLDAASPGTCPEVLAPARSLALELLREDAHERYLALWRAGAFAADRQRYVLEGAQPVWRPLLDGVDVDVLTSTVPWTQLPVRTNLVSARWDRASAVLELHGHHYHPGLDLAGTDATHQLELDGPGGRLVQPAEVDADPLQPPQANVVGVDHGPGAFAVRIPVAALARAAGGSGGTVRLSVRTRLAGHDDVDALPGGAKWFSARRLAPVLLDGLLLTPRMLADGFAVDVSRPVVWLRGLRETDAGLELELGGDPVRLRLGDRRPLPVVSGSVVVPQAELAFLAGRGADVPLLAEGQPVDASGARQATVAADVVSGPLAGNGQLAADADGHAVLRCHRQYLRLDLLEFGPDGLRAVVTGFLPSGSVLKAVALRSRATAVAATRAADGWHIALAGVPAGGYDLVGEVAGPDRQRRVRVSAGPDYLDAVGRRYEVAGKSWRPLVSEAGFVHLDTPPEPGAAENVPSPT